MELETVIFLVIAAGFAGFVDAMAGGGGLIQLPALLIGISEKSIPTIFGTNKVISIFGTTTAAANYFKKVAPDLKLTLYMAFPAFLGSAYGAHLASLVPISIFRPLIVAALVAVAIYTWIKPELGMAEVLRFTQRQRHQIVIALGLTIGFYDGIFGPGTGTFLVFLLVGLVGYAFLKASATAKLINIATNLGAIISFQLSGNILWRLGLGLALANIFGAIIGAKLAIRGGSPLVRKAFLLITTILIAKVGYDWLAK